MLSRRSFVLTVFALLFLGTAGYAYLNPVFAAECKSAYVKSTTWARQQAFAAESAFKKTAFYASYKAALNESAARRQSRSQARAAPASSPSASQRPAQAASLTAGHKIANGHAFAKHANEFGFATAEQMGDHIDGVISQARPSNVRRLLRGRVAYWDDGSGTVVIVDPNTADGGTAFKPDRGRSYFESLR